VLAQVSIQRLKDVPPHTCIVVKTSEAAWAACCTPSNDAHCAMFKMALEMTMPLFTAQSRFDVLGLAVGLLGWTTGFLVALSCFVGGIGIVVFKKGASNFIC
jgi:hypothetical protein